MAYRYGDRRQCGLFPQSIEEYVSNEDPVRVYDSFVESLDFSQLGIDLNEGQVGNSEYDPRAMLKVLVYGYSYGVKGSRKLERECHHNLSFIWLMGGLKPDHKTIAEFRRRHKTALKQVLKQCVQLCVKLDLIAGNVLFVDGTKIRANAARGKTHDRARYEKRMTELDQRVEKLLEQCEREDREQEGLGSSVAMGKELAQAERLQEKIKQALKTMEESGAQKINLTDPDCALMHSVQGSHASYNVQSVVDDQHGLIVHVQAISETSDVNQFAKQIDQANKLLNKPCEVGCADAGYADSAELKKIDDQGIKVVVPSQRQALHKKEDKPFSKSHFRYDQEKDCYFCPEQKQLPYEFTDQKRGKKYYRISQSGLCHSCVHYGQCTSNKNGRRIMRLVLEDLKEKFEALYEGSKEIYARRKTRAEHPFGHIKKNLKTDGFMLRGKDGVQAETSLLATCFDLRRMMTIVGISALIEKLTAPAILAVK
ncbi:MAG TPA: IS1182 family transposase [Pyrinomonadaceae bacterium]